VKAQAPVPAAATPELVGAVTEAIKAQAPELAPALATPELVNAVAQALTPPPPPPPDPMLISQGRVFNDNDVATSSFDESDVVNYEITRSSFDDSDLINEHPTGP
jgi:hypothetical protein